MEQLEAKQVELRTHMEANKVEAESTIGQLKVALESDLKTTTSNLEVKIDRQKVIPEQGVTFPEPLFSTNILLGTAVGSVSTTFCHQVDIPKDERHYF